MFKYITKIDSAEKHNRVVSVLKKHYSSTYDKILSAHNIGIEFGKFSGYTKIYSIYSVFDDEIPKSTNPCSIESYEDSILSYPDVVIDFLISKSKQKSINPFLIYKSTDEDAGGITWENTKEGYKCFDDIILSKNFSRFEKNNTIKISVTGIDTAKKKEYVCNFIHKYLSNGDYLKPNILNDSIGFEINVVKLIGSNHIEDIRLLNIVDGGYNEKEADKIKKFEDTILSHSFVTINKLLKISRLKSVLPFLNYLGATWALGGFNWNETKEGHIYWEKLLSTNEFETTINCPTKEMTKTVDILEINTKEKIEKLKYVFSEYLNFPITELEFGKKNGYGIRIKLKINRTDEGELLDAKITEVLYIKSFIVDETKTFNHSVVALPDDILKVLVKNSSINSLIPYLLNIFAITIDGGFCWDKSKEGYDYWDTILNFKNIENLKTTYKPLSTMCKINYKTKKLISKEANEEKKVDFYVRETQLGVENELLNREKERAEVEEKLNDLKSSYPLDLNNIIKNQTRLEELDTEIKVIKNLKKDLGFDKEDKTKEGK